MDKAHILVFFGFTFLLGSCELLLESRCPSLAENEFLQFEIGESRTYTYEDARHTAFDSGEARDIGTISFEIEDVSECEKGEISVRVSETVDYISQSWIHTEEKEHLGWQDTGYTFSSTRFIEFKISDIVSLEYLTHDNIPFTSFQSKRSTLLFEQIDEESPQIRTIFQLEFERGKGLVSWTREGFWYRTRFSRKLTLIE